MARKATSLHSHALLKAMGCQTDHPSQLSPWHFLEFPRYRDLYAQTHIGSDKVGVTLLFVRESGDVEVLGQLEFAMMSSVDAP